MICRRLRLDLFVPLLVLGLSAFLVPTAVRGQTVVTACGTDVATGGTNLATALAQGGQIVIRCRTGSPQITMTRAHVIRRSTTLDGEGRITLDGGRRTSFFEVPQAGTRLVLRRLTLQGGLNTFLHHPGSDAPTGGIVSSRGGVELWAVRTRNSRAPYDVKALSAFDGSVFESNDGAFVISADHVQLVGAILADNVGAPIRNSRQRRSERPRASIERSEIRGNRQPSQWFGDLHVQDSRFTANSGNSTGGGAFSLEGVTARIERSEFVNNQAGNGGAILIASGNLAIYRATFSGNRAQNRGGAIDVVSGSIGLIDLELRFVKFRQNAAGSGGAVSLAGRLTGGPVLFAANNAGQHGGALDLVRGTATLARAVFVDNRAGLTGGAIRSGATGFDRVTLGNTLMVRNAASNGGAFSGRTLDLTHASVVDNEGAGIAIVANALGGEDGGLRLRNSLLARNAGGNCAAPAASIADDGHNLQFPAADCGTTVTTAEPMLDTFYIPHPGSPARFAAAEETCRGSPLVQGRDVYGGERPAEGPCAIGAVEHDLERHAARLLASRRELPLAARNFLVYLGILGRED